MRSTDPMNLTLPLLQSSESLRLLGKELVAVKDWNFSRFVVSVLMMGKLYRCMVLPLLLAPILTSQQSDRHAPRIVCAPSTMKVLKMVKPTYPPDAKSKDMFGMVAVEAEVDKTGKPASVKVLRGDPVLALAVVEAVKKWRWEPLKLNGEAVEAVTTITVNFEPR
jgi:TonB family protein